MTYEFTCYCTDCGKDFTEAEIYPTCPNCGQDSEEHSPVYYRDTNGIRYEDQDLHLNRSGRNRDDICG